MILFILYNIWVDINCCKCKENGNELTPEEDRSMKWISGQMV